MKRYIDIDSALQAHPEFLNEQIDDHDKAIYAKGWNACNSVYYGSIKELPFISPDDVRGVGKWSEDAMRIKCSACGTDFNDEVTCCSDCYRWPWNYCPNCGAKMEVSEDV